MRLVEQVTKYHIVHAENGDDLFYPFGRMPFGAPIAFSLSLPPVRPSVTAVLWRSFVVQVAVLVLAFGLECWLHVGYTALLCGVVTCLACQIVAAWRLRKYTTRIPIARSLAEYARVLDPQHLWQQVFLAILMIGIVIWLKPSSPPLIVAGAFFLLNGAVAVYLLWSTDFEKRADRP